jgi:hypothetical protein
MKIGWSNFARGRHKKDNGYSYFDGADEVLFQAIKDNWGARTVGAGATNIDRVCVVPVPVSGFYCPMVAVDLATNLEAEVMKRRPDEESYVRVTANGPEIEAKFVKVVLYSAQTLIDEKEERSGDFDWEIISLMASPVENEPVPPQTMARNQLGMKGGSPRQYTSEEWARSVWYWSQYVTRRV